ncbi:hypothetical protein Dimus_031879, partial [Dionaea muscipula]
MEEVHDCSIAINVCHAERLIRSSITSGIIKVKLPMNSSPRLMKTMKKPLHCPEAANVCIWSDVNPKPPSTVHCHIKPTRSCSSPSFFMQEIQEAALLQLHVKIANTSLI